MNAAAPMMPRPIIYTDTDGRATFRHRHAVGLRLSRAASAAGDRALAFRELQYAAWARIELRRELQFHRLNEVRIGWPLEHGEAS